MCGEKITIDAVLIRMAQLNQLKAKLDVMRKMSEKTRLNNRGLNGTNPLIEYRYAHFSIGLVSRDYDAVDAEITEMQLALDKFNQTFEFDVDVKL